MNTTAASASAINSNNRQEEALEVADRIVVIAFRALQLAPGAVAYLRPTRVRHFDDATTTG